MTLDLEQAIWDSSIFKDEKVELYISKPLIFLANNLALRRNTYQLENKNFKKE